MTMSHTMTEAFCTKCRETFIPESEHPMDLEHGAREDGEFCGGQGQITGDWVYTPELMPTEPKLNSQERIEDVAFEGLIRRYTERRNFGLVNSITQLYGLILEDRDQ